MRARVYKLQNEVSFTLWRTPRSADRYYLVMLTFTAALKSLKCPLCRFLTTSTNVELFKEKSVSMRWNTFKISWTHHFMLRNEKEITITMTLVKLNFLFSNWISKTKKKVRVWTEKAVGILWKNISLLKQTFISFLPNPEGIERVSSFFLKFFSKQGYILCEFCFVSA